MKRIKHSKFKNTGILFELLVRQITIEVLNNSKEQNAQRILKEFFATKTELSKELKLYNLILKEKYNSENRAEKFIELVCEEHVKKIDYAKLNKEKYNLVKEIKRCIDDIDQFLSSSIQNYKELASTYKIFESTRQSNYDLKDVFNSKYTLVEYVMNDTIKNKDKKVEERVIQEYKSQEKDLRLLTYKILVENFNEKYSTLNESQRNLLKRYINDITNTTNFKDYLKTEIPTIVENLQKLNKKINDKVTNIKLKETISLLKNMKFGRKINESQVTTIMLSYELIKELQKRVK